MKILSLNLWGGKLYDELSGFIRKQSASVDVFCFQEMFDQKELPVNWSTGTPDLYSRFKKILGDFTPFITMSYNRYAPFNDGNSNNGLKEAIFVRKQLKAIESGSIELCKRVRDSMFEGMPFRHYPKLQYVILENNGEKILVANVHGIWIKGSRNDCEERTEQSDSIIQFMEDRPYKRILCGDFNYTLNTECNAIIEKKFTNLIRKNNIASTRSSYYKSLGEGDTFADYVYVSKGMKVENFEVLNAAVSDHLPLKIEIR